MVKLDGSQIVRLGFICALGIILIFFINSMQEIQLLQSGEIIIAPELKQIEKGVSIGFKEPLLCVGNECNVLTQKMFSIINEMNTFQFYLIIIAISMLTFEVVEIFKNRLFLKK